MYFQVICKTGSPQIRQSVRRKVKLLSLISKVTINPPKYLKHTGNSAVVDVAKVILPRLASKAISPLFTIEYDSPATFAMQNSDGN